MESYPTRSTPLAQILAVRTCAPAARINSFPADLSVDGGGHTGWRPMQLRQPSRRERKDSRKHLVVTVDVHDVSGVLLGAGRDEQVWDGDTMVA